MNDNKPKFYILKSVTIIENECHINIVKLPKLNCMKNCYRKFKMAGILIVSIVLLNSTNASACSTFMLHKGGKLIFGHNLNEGDIGVPGIVFINKRGVFKMGRSLNELMFKEVTKPSNLSWISRYGSVTFNNFGKDLPDGGMNEAGFYIWEMNEDADYPKGDSLQWLSQMGWMQFLLDNCTTLDEAIKMTESIEIDGWGWHYFLADASGDCAALAFIDGKMKINRGKNMPVKGLFNTPYDREMEIARYYENFGGQYKVELDSPNVPRFVKTDFLIKNYDPLQNIVDYGFYMLDKIKVFDVAEWSIVFDPIEKQVYFRTRINPAIKNFSLNDVDFSSQAGPCMIQNMDIEKGGNVLALMHPCTAKEMSEFLNYMGTLIPHSFFEMGGLTFEQVVDNFSNHSLRASLPENQFFKGRWETIPKDLKEGNLSLTFNTAQDAVFGNVTASDGRVYQIDHLYMLNNKITLTFLTKSGRMLELKGIFDKDQLNAKVSGTEDFMGSFVFYKKD